MDKTSFYKKVQKRTNEILNSSNDGDIPSKICDITIMTLVILNVLSVIIGTVPSIKAEYGTPLRKFEFVSVILFSIEYVLRVWSCVMSELYQGSIRGRIKYMLSFMALIDLLAILPFYLSFMKVDLRVIRIMRLFRIFRIAKLGRYTKGLNLIRDVFIDKKEELILTIVAMFFMLIMSSSVMYYLENDAQPDQFSSIPAAMWWGVCTLTTVGYGDLYPITLPGKIVAAFISMLGIGMFVLPAGILASGFENALNQNNPDKDEQSATEAGICPHCGRKLEDE